MTKEQLKQLGITEQDIRAWLAVDLWQIMDDPLYPMGITVRMGWKDRDNGIPDISALNGLMLYPLEDLRPTLATNVRIWSMDPKYFKSRVKSGDIRIVTRYKEGV